MTCVCCDEGQHHFVEIRREWKSLWCQILIRGNGICFGSALHEWISDLEPRHLVDVS